MEHSNFYSDRKFCTQCCKYVSYLVSLEHSYCCECGSRVRLFSENDWTHFHENLERNRPRGGRPKKGKESA